jgi:hypothetical protein
VIICIPGDICAVEEIECPDLRHIGLALIDDARVRGRKNRVKRPIGVVPHSADEEIAGGGAEVRGGQSRDRGSRRTLRVYQTGERRTTQECSTREGEKKLFH